MVDQRFNFEFVEKSIRKKSFGLITTISPKENPQTTGVLYGVSPPNTKLSLYVLTEDNLMKVNNILNNPSISFAIPYPHFYFRMIPASMVHFQGKATILPFGDNEATRSFETKYILKMMLKKVEKMNWDKEKMLFIKMQPNKKILCYGLGMSVFEIRKHTENSGYHVIVPKERR